MSNTIIALQPLLFSSAQVVANEPVGFLGAISNTFDDKGVAVGDKVIVPVAPAASVATYTPGMTTTAGTDAIATNVEVTISANQVVSWNLTGEQMRSLENADSSKEWARQMFEQGMRALRNAAEAAAWQAALNGASRAVGAAGTTPFVNTAGTNVEYQLNILSAAKKVLMDQGCPTSGISAVINTSAGMNLRNLGAYQNFYQAGSDAQLRNGIFLPAFGMSIAESAQIGTGGGGTASSLVTTAASNALGAVSIGVGGQGCALSLSANDFVTFGTTPSTYAYQVTNATALTAAGNLTLNRPGIVKTALTQGQTVTVASAYTGNIVLEKTSVVGAVRPPLLPPNPLIQQQMVGDTKSGLTFLFCDIAGDGMRTWRLHLAYGFKAVQPAFIVAALG